MEKSHVAGADPPKYAGVIRTAYVRAVAPDPCVNVIANALFISDCDGSCTRKRAPGAFESWVIVGVATTGTATVRFPNEVIHLYTYVKLVKSAENTSARARYVSPEL